MLKAFASFRKGFFFDHNVWIGSAVKREQHAGLGADRC